MYGFERRNSDELAEIMAHEQMINMDSLGYYLPMARELPDVRRTDALLLMFEDYSPKAL